MNFESSHLVVVVVCKICEGYIFDANLTYLYWVNAEQGSAPTDFQRSVIENSDILPIFRKPKMLKNVSALFQLDFDKEVQETWKGTP